MQSSGYKQHIHNLECICKTVVIKHRTGLKYRSIYYKKDRMDVLQNRCWNAEYARLFSWIRVHDIDTIRTDRPIFGGGAVFRDTVCKTHSKWQCRAVNSHGKLFSKSRSWNQMHSSSLSQRPQSPARISVFSSMYQNGEKKAIPLRTKEQNWSRKESFRI